MKDFEQILAFWSQLEARGESAVLATVVKTSGSSYRLPGARLLLSQTGQRVGSVSGGCLEHDLVKKAWWLTENGPVVRRYDTTPDGEIAAEYGLGCNGIIHVLLERVQPGNAEMLDLIREVRATRQPVSIVHVIAPASRAGQRCVIAPGHSPSSGAKAGDDAEVFIETVNPPLRLLVCGAGEDAVPLVTLGKFLGWEVWVFDGRAHYARREKFPNADQVIVRAPGSAPRLDLDRWTAAVLMSHSYSQDLSMLKELAGEKLCYLGALGPRKRAMQMLADLGMEHLINDSHFHTPVGLDIGADGGEQVALAVAAEIQATLNGRSGGSLRERAGSIHADADMPEAAWVRSVVCA